MARDKTQGNVARDKTQGMRHEIRHRGMWHEIRHKKRQGMPHEGVKVQNLLKQLADCAQPLYDHGRLYSRFFHPLGIYLHCVCKHPICTNLWTQYGVCIMNAHNEDIFAALLLLPFTQGTAAIP